jgi:hypothetical protein
VNAEALAVQMLTHIQTLPTLHTLRLCNRFGHGRFKDFPVELVKMIEGHVASSVREKLAERATVASRCFRNDCSLIDHADKEMLMDLYREGVEAFNLEHYPRTPNDSQLMRVLRDYYQPYPNTGIDEEEAHQHNRDSWLTTIGRIFSEASRAMFLTKFGLDIWFSFVRLDRRYRQKWGAPQATIAYLTSPGSVTRQYKWDGDAHVQDVHGNDYIIQSSYGENGFGMDVGVFRQLSAEELSKFTKASRILKLDVFVHPSQTHSPALGLGSSDEPGDPAASESQGFESADGEHDSTNTGSPDGDDKTTMHSFPRLMLLTRNKERDEN